MPSPWPLRSGELTLRDARPEDVETLLAFRNDADVNRFMMRTHVDPEVFRADWAAAPGSETDHSCVAELDGRVVAMGFLEYRDAGYHPETPKGVEALIGYIVDPRHWGRGIATDLARGLLTAAFDRLGMRRVVAYCNRDNAASVRVLERAGMRREEHGVEDSRHAELGWVDGYGYAVLAEEWRGEASGLREVRDASATAAPRRPLPGPVRGESWPRRSDRFVLDLATDDDVDQMLAYRNRPEVGRWLLRETVEPQAFHTAWLDGSDPWSFIARLDGRVVGSGSITVRDGQGQPGGPVQGCEAEVGYIVNPEFAGRGVGREIAAAALDLSFGPVGVRRVVAGLYCANTPSRRILSGIGMRLEQYGVLDSWLPREGWIDGDLWPARPGVAHLANSGAVTTAAALVPAGVEPSR